MRSPAVVSGLRFVKAPAAVPELVPPFAIGRIPTTPVVKESPVPFVKTTLDGVPNAGVIKVGLVASTTVDPVPVVVAALRGVALSVNAGVVRVELRVNAGVVPPDEEPANPLADAIEIAVTPGVTVAQAGSPATTVKTCPVVPIASRAAVPALTSYSKSPMVDIG